MNPPPPPGAFSLLPGGAILLARALTQGTLGPVPEFLFKVCFVIAGLPARAVNVSIRNVILPARAVVVFFPLAVVPAWALVSGTQNSILPAWALTDVLCGFL